MNFQQRIESAIGKKKKDPYKVFHEISFVLAKEFGWGYNDIMEAPIPFVIEVLSELSSFRKREEAAMKKARRK